ncbi:AAA family ATPase [Gordonia McavH-238-E]|nr:AAA family ATPase [Gordonia sp. McavH-238-E]
MVTIQIEKLRSRFRATAVPHIESIRFPHFKALEKDLNIDFTFPITALVGQNGSNKSSILHALDCAPGRRSMSNHWFSTSLDPINRLTKKDQHRFIYSYIARASDGTSRLAEVRKSRVTKEFRNDWIPQALRGQKDPDYWEPTKRVDIDAMAPLPTDSLFDSFMSPTKDRWNALKKPVIYLDFRDELSAYDKFVHHTAADQWTRTSTGRRYRVITRSYELSEAFTTMKRVGDRILEKPIELSSDATASVSQILGKKFDRIRLVRHKCYGVEGYSALITLAGKSYSEAHAGSGEFAVVRLVAEVSEAPESALVLLDEPEVSLHPGAQTRLMDYIGKMCLKKGLQVVLSTHSLSIIQGLPPDAIKLLGTNGQDSTVRLLSDHTYPHQAFFNLGYVSTRTHAKVLVEDKFVEEIVKTAMRVHEPSTLQSVEPTAVPGGADRIIRTVVPTLAVAGTTDTVVLLDGDQLKALPEGSGNPHEPTWDRIDELPTDASTPAEAAALVKRWRELVEEILGTGSSFEIYGRDSDSFRSDKTEVSEINRNLRWCRSHVRFLAGYVPEAMLAHELDDQYDLMTPTSEAKKYFVHLAEQDIDPEYERVTAEDILAKQKTCLVRLAKKSGAKSALLQSAYDAVRTALQDAPADL